MDRFIQEYNSFFGVYSNTNCKQENGYYIISGFRNNVKYWLKNQEFGNVKFIYACDYKCLYSLLLKYGFCVLKYNETTLWVGPYNLKNYKVSSICYKDSGMPVAWIDTKFIGVPNLQEGIVYNPNFELSMVLEYEDGKYHMLYQRDELGVFYLKDEFDNLTLRHMFDIEKDEGFLRLPKEKYQYDTEYL